MTNLPDRQQIILSGQQRAHLDRLNTRLVIGICSSALLLMYLSAQTGLAGCVLIGVVFSFLLLTNYALMHEAAHGVLHSNPTMNRILGMVSCNLFPMPFTLYKITHIVHHCCNRTDHEMFDCYYQHDIRVLKYIQWYGLLLGLWWPLIPIGALLVALFPPLFHSAPFRNARSTGVLFDDFGPSEIRQLRIEVLLNMIFWTAFIMLLDLSLSHLLILYLCFGFNWSTRQYVTHAFTVRDVRNGALNLKVSRLFGWILLNGQWDLVHHRHPQLPWYYLPQAGRDYPRGESYWRQYLKLWRGPVLARAPGPAVLKKELYDTF